MKTVNPPKKASTYTAWQQMISGTVLPEDVVSYLCSIHNATDVDVHQIWKDDVIVSFSIPSGETLSLTYVKSITATAINDKLMICATLDQRKLSELIYK